MTIAEIIALAHDQQWPRARLADEIVGHERARVLAIIRDTPRAALDDGRDLVVRTDITRKVQHG